MIIGEKHTPNMIYGLQLYSKKTLTGVTSCVMMEITITSSYKNMFIELVLYP